MSELKSAHELGVPYLSGNVSVETSDPLTVTLADKPDIGIRSVYEKLSFRSTLEGLPAGKFGKIELRISRGTTKPELPALLHLENGAFWLTQQNTGRLLAGDKTRRMCAVRTGEIYTIEALLFRKALYCRLSGPGIDGGGITIEVPDRERFIPTLPGFALVPEKQATGGTLAAFDWFVSPVGPYRARLGAIGDSLTAGPVSEPETESYVHRTTAALGQRHVLNVGSGGATTAQDLLRFPYELAPFEPDIVWIEGGTNDRILGVEAEETFANMMAQARLVTWGGQAVLSTVPPLGMPNAAQYDELFRLNELIRASGLPFVDRYAIVCDPHDRTRIRPEFCHADGVHILKAGNDKIAEHAIEVMRSVKQSRSSAR